MEYYAAIRNYEFVSFVGTWRNLENIILSKLTQEQKVKQWFFGEDDGFISADTEWLISSLFTGRQISLCNTQSWDHTAEPL